jgi:hypothetical protein
MGKREKIMTTAKTAKTAAPVARKRAPRKPAAPKGVSLTRVTPKRSSGVKTDYSGFVRALWNMGDAAETATGGNAWYAARRDALLDTFISHL